MEKVYAVSWSREEHLPRYTNFIFANDAKDAKKQVLAAGIAKVVYGAIRQPSLENDERFLETYNEWRD